MSKKRHTPLPAAVLVEDLLDTPRRADRSELTWLRRPTGRAQERPGDQDGSETA